MSFSLSLHKKGNFFYIDEQKQMMILPVFMFKDQRSFRLAIVPLIELA